MSLLDQLLLIPLPPQPDVDRVRIEKSPELARLGESVRREREFMGWSAAELAARAGVHLNTVYGLETGRHDVYYTTLAAIADALGVEASDLVRWAEEEEE